jgi:micrococcal nuclease
MHGYRRGLCEGGTLAVWALQFGLAFPPLAAASDLPSFAGLRLGPIAAVAEVLDGHTLRLVDHPGRVRLSGLWPENAGSSLDSAAASYLRGKVEGLTVQLFFDRREKDRYGTWLGQVAVVDRSGHPSAWLQGEMLQAGLARVYTTVGNDALATEMLALEEEARRAGEGLWSDRAFQVRNGNAPPAGLSKFQVVEGDVKDVFAGRDAIYINFGADWRSDMTAVIERSNVGNFEGGLRFIRKWKDRRVRVRGWVFSWNGPAIRVDHAALVETLR